MIKGTQNTGYSPAWYFVLDDLVWRYDGVCVDRCADTGRMRSASEFKALQERIALKQIFSTKIADKKGVKMKVFFICQKCGKEVQRSLDTNPCATYGDFYSDLALDSTESKGILKRIAMWVKKQLCTLVLVIATLSYRICKIRKEQKC